MKANELQLKREDFHFSTKIYKPKSHYKFLMRMGRVLPTTKAQAKHFIQSKCEFGVLNSYDVGCIEAIFAECGKEGEYRYTKSRTWVRLTNIEDFYNCLKQKYNL